MKFVNFFEMNNLGVQTEILVKSMFKIFLAFAILKPSTVIQGFILDIYVMIMHLSFKPLPMLLRIFSWVKLMHSRSTFLFLSFYNTEKLVDFGIITQATPTNYWILHVIFETNKI